jgi:diguanylate cyclase (GGDEF)-like protein
MDEAEIIGLLDKLKVFDKMYEVIRIVDPLSKKVLSYTKNEIKESDFNCFDIWGRNKICDNCISMRSFLDNQTFIKVEYNPNKIYMITSVPIELNKKRVVVELMKDATGSMVFENSETESTGVCALIDSINSIAMRDALTGIYNRRYLNEKLPTDIIRNAISEQSLSIIMTDIDFFKKVNDQYGHLTGDAVLKCFTEILTEFLTKADDWVARFGGEEFVICLPGRTVEEAADIAEKIRKAIEERNFECCGEQIKITASFGVSGMKANQSISAEDLLITADERLYDAKHNGRNKVEY